MLLYQIALTLIREVGPVNGKKLMAYMGSPREIFEGDRKKLAAIPGISRKLVQEITSNEPLQNAEKEMQYIERHQIRPLFFTDKGYPRRLRHCEDAPLMLYYKGNADVNYPRVVAIVGTRSATSYGSTMCEKIIEGLKDADVMVISGLASGIDSLAHRHALKTQMPTIGVVAHGHDTMYPAQNRNLAKRMQESGGVISEWSSGVVPEKIMFPRRNRIIAGMSDVVVVVEAAYKGGALITADIANSYNRDVVAVPGRIYDKYSQGCNQLIKNNEAALATCAQDVLKLMGWETIDKTTRSMQKELFQQLTGLEQKIVEMLAEHGPSGVDWLATEMNIPGSKLSSALLKLEFGGLLKSIPGNQYQLA